VSPRAGSLPPLTPHEVAGFRILRALGGGSSARVFLAEHPLRHRPVAVKLVHADLQTDSDALEHLLGAVERARGLRHPHLEQVIEVLRSSDSVQIVTEFLPGGSLRERLDASGHLPVAVVLALVRQILAALAALHRRGLVHRDVKPGNVLFDAEGRAVLVDFGLLTPIRPRGRPEPADSVLPPAQGQGSSHAGVIAGTAAYMAPEQARGERVDGRADLYSLGVMCFELLTGRLPYVAEDPLALAELHAVAAVPELPDALVWLQPLMDGLMAKQPEDRLSSAAAVLDVLETLVLAEPAAADLAPRSTSRLLRAPRRPAARWRWFALGLLGLLLLGLITALAVAILQQV
jgi:serine/threonine protein kinase